MILLSKESYSTAPHASKAPTVFAWARHSSNQARFWIAAAGHAKDGKHHVRDHGMNLSSWWAAALTHSLGADKETGPRRLPQHPELAIWGSGLGALHRGI